MDVERKAKPAVLLKKKYCFSGMKNLKGERGDVQDCTLYPKCPYRLLAWS